MHDISNKTLLRKTRAFRERPGDARVSWLASSNALAFVVNLWAWGSFSAGILRDTEHAGSNTAALRDLGKKELGHLTQLKENPNVG